MVTIWPLDDPQASQAKADDCEFVLDHYDLVASQLAISDAQKQHVNFEGEGPSLSVGRHLKREGYLTL